MFSSLNLEDVQFPAVPLNVVHCEIEMGGPRPFWKCSLSKDKSEASRNRFVNKSTLKEREKGDGTYIRVLHHRRLEDSRPAPLSMS